jgi:hypothetical protein
MNNINDLTDCLNLIAYLRAEPASDINNPTRGVGVPRNKRKKSQCHPPKNFIMPPSTPANIAFALRLAKNLATQPLSPSLPLGYPHSALQKPYNPLSRLPPSAPAASPFAARHQAFLDVSQAAERSARRFLKYVKQEGWRGYNTPYLADAFVKNVLAIGAFLDR